MVGCDCSKCVRINVMSSMAVQVVRAVSRGADRVSKGRRVAKGRCTKCRHRRQRLWKVGLADGGRATQTACGNTSATQAPACRAGQSRRLSSLPLLGRATQPPIWPLPPPPALPPPHSSAVVFMMPMPSSLPAPGSQAGRQVSSSMVECWGPPAADRASQLNLPDTASQPASCSSSSSSRHTWDPAAHEAMHPHQQPGGRASGPVRQERLAGAAVRLWHPVQQTDGNQGQRASPRSSHPGPQPSKPPTHRMSSCPLARSRYMFRRHSCSHPWQGVNQAPTRYRRYSAGRGRGSTQVHARRTWDVSQAQAALVPLHAQGLISIQQHASTAGIGS